MDALISLVYTIIDSACVCLFLDAFASHRWRDHRFLVGVIVQTILMYASIEFSVIALNRNQIVKILLILLSCFIVARTLYENISGKWKIYCNNKYIIIGKNYINKQSLCRSYLKSVVHTIVIAFFVYKSFKFIKNFLKSFSFFEKYNELI